METTLWEPKSLKDLKKALNSMEQGEERRFGGIDHATNKSPKRNEVSYIPDESVSELHKDPQPEKGARTQDLHIEVVPEKKKDFDWKDFITPKMEKHQLVEWSDVYVGKYRKKLTSIIVLRRVKYPFDNKYEEKAKLIAARDKRISEAEVHQKRT